MAHLFRQWKRASVSWKMPPSVWRWLDGPWVSPGMFQGKHFFWQMELEVRTFLYIFEPWMFYDVFDELCLYVDMSQTTPSMRAANWRT